MADFTDNLSFQSIRPGLSLADYVSGPVEVKVVKIAEGAEIPLHSHSDEVVHLVVSGELEFNEGHIVGPLADYNCGGWEYRGRAVKDTIMLIIQPVGTTFEFSDEK